MAYVHIAVLAVVQGITEFLPVSSSGHLVLVPLFLQVPDQGLLIDIAVHVGTLGAVILYFWRDMWSIFGGITRLLKGRRDRGSKLAGLLLIGSVPVVAAGFLLNNLSPGGIRGLEVIGWATLGFGVLLLIADKIGMTLRRIEHLRWGDAVIIGMAQALALIPGTSRSGICMTAGRMMGMERHESARFAMLLGIPAIFAAGALKGWELYQSDNFQLTLDAILAAGLSFLTALVAITLMMAWLRRASFTIFGVYRILLGIFLLAISYRWIS
ncbi:MAG: undecaprenyl-diphosphatase [Rhodospirillaceae bacterium TMED8]|nr:undecaprenyl-diphosphate phosphatase [Magnetovibrio sp.]OUT53242.1 MAG: undecaprenyl-diphosphatase [Rhodospirillaceae bacterium TMED8]